MTEFYLRPKLEALRNLHAVMVRSHFQINAVAHNGVQTIEEFALIQREETEYLGVLTAAEIYLDSETSEAMRAVLGALRQMTASIFLRVPAIFDKGGRHNDAALLYPDWKPFHESYDIAHKKLGHLLNPQELMKWAEK